MWLPRILRKRIKHNNMVRFYSKFITQDDLCYDIGAHAGERAMCFTKLGAKIVLVEPQWAFYNKLLKQFQNVKNSVCVHAAVTQFPGTTQLMLCDESSECATLSQEFIDAYSIVSDFHWSKTEMVPCVTLAELISRYGLPAFVKIDVEGYESVVLSTLREPISLISFEFNKYLLHDTFKTLELLKGVGNYECNFIQYEFMKFVMHEWVDIDTFCASLKLYIPDNVLTGEIFVRLKS